MRLARTTTVALMFGLTAASAFAEPLVWRPAGSGKAAPAPAAAAPAVAAGDRPVTVGRPVPLGVPATPAIQRVSAEIRNQESGVRNQESGIRSAADSTLIPGFSRVRSVIRGQMPELAPPPAMLGPPLGSLPAPGSMDPYYEGGCSWEVIEVVSSDPCCHGRWTGGGGLYFIQPTFETNPAYRLHKRLGPDRLANTQQDFRHGMEAAPLAWIGYVNSCGLGIRGRWFQFEQAAHEFVTKDDSFLQIFHPNPLALNVDFGDRDGSQFSFSSNLKLQVWDLEATTVLHDCNWCLLLAAGVRYAHLSQDYHAFGPRSETSLTINSGHNFNGAGPTIAFEAKRTLCHGLAVYGNARGSLLFGTAKQVAHEFVTVDATGALEHSTLNTTQQADVLPVGELEIGVECGRHFGKVRAFVQAGLVGQVWWGAGNATNTAVTGINPDNTGNLGFVGGVFRLGFTF